MGRERIVIHWYSSLEELQSKFSLYTHDIYIGLVGDQQSSLRFIFLQV